MDPALRKSHKAYFRGFFLLHLSVIINGQPSQVGPNEQGWLTLRCPGTNTEVTFNDLYTCASTAIKNFGGIDISNYWCDDVPLFQLNISSADSLQKLVSTRCKLQGELTAQISQMFKTETQVQVQPKVFLILPSTFDTKGQIIHVLPDNAIQCIELWERSAAFTFQDVFQQWSDHIRRMEPILGQLVCRIYLNFMFALYIIIYYIHVIIYILR